MTEDQARQVVLLQAREQAADSAPASTPWSLEDRAWATRQALASVGEDARPEAFVTARAALALQRLLPRDRPAQRWMSRRLWHPAWVPLALLVGLLFGLGVDQLGPPGRVNLLAPAVWAVVAWNFLVYLLILLPTKGTGLRQTLAQWGLGSASGRLLGVNETWAELALPLSLKRWGVLMHAAAAALAMGLVAGLYLRGLVLDYRAGWESTFLDAAQVQGLLHFLLWPASQITRIALPALAPLQLAPGTAAQASAAPWIHLYATTLVLAVVLPRTVLALLAAARARWQAQHFVLPLDTPYFEALAPLMQPRQPRALRLLWVAEAGVGATEAGDGSGPKQPRESGAAGPADKAGDPVAAGLLHLFGSAVPRRLDAPLIILKSDEGDELQLLPPPQAALQPQPAAPEKPAPWWQPWRSWRDPSRDWLPALQQQTDAVLLLLPAGNPRPEWLAKLGRPVVTLQLPTAGASGPAVSAKAVQAALPTSSTSSASDTQGTRPFTPTRDDAEDKASGFDEAMDKPAPADTQTLPLHELAEGWLPQGRLLKALTSALPADMRLLRLQASWQRRQLKRLESGAALLARLLAQTADTRVPLADNGLLSRRADAEAARLALAATLQTQWQQALQQLTAFAGTSGGRALVPADARAGNPGQAPNVALHKRMGEKRSALVGGVLTGALAGLKADVLSGGMTMGAGLVTGGILGALGGAGVARGFNFVRGTDSGHATWDEDALLFITEGLMTEHLMLNHGLDEAAARSALHPALAAAKDPLSEVWALDGKSAGSKAAEAQAPVHRPDVAPVSTLDKPSKRQQALAAQLQPLLVAVMQQALGGPQT